MRGVVALVVEKGLLLGEEVDREDVFEFEFAVLGGLVLLLPLEFLLVDFVLVDLRVELLSLFHWE